MIDRFLDILKKTYVMSEVDAGEFAKLKAKGMKFIIHAYHANGLGHVSVMKASGFFGLMKMDTLMIVPQEKDLPLYSYDRIHAMGNDTLIVELYDTMTENLDLSALNEVKDSFKNLPERNPGEHWYDSIRLSQSISKKTKKAHSRELDDMALSFFNAYLKAPAKMVTDTKKKAELSTAYVNGLLEQGGPSTDVFKKALGEQDTARLFRDILFGTKE